MRWLFLIHGIQWQAGCRFYGSPIIQKHRFSHMSFGAGMALRSRVSSNPLGPHHPVILSTWRQNARLEIGEHFAMTGGAICATEHITIGNQVVIGANTTIVDTDFHPLDPDQRLTQSNEGRSAPVIIEDNVFIGMNCLILKGVTIAQGSVIGAGSVVTRNVPSFVVAAGNPAVVVREIRKSL